MQKHRVCRLVESANKGIADGEDGNPQLAILMDEDSPQIGLGNLSPIPIPPHHLTANLDIQCPESPCDVNRLAAPDRVPFNIMVNVGDAMQRKKLFRLVAGGSSWPIVQDNIGHPFSRPARVRRPTHHPFTDAGSI